MYINDARACCRSGREREACLEQLALFASSVAYFFKCDAVSFSVLFPRLLWFTIYDNSCVMYIIESMTPKHTAANANRAADLDKLVLPSGPAACSRIIDVHHVFFRVSLNLIYIHCKVLLAQIV